MPFLCDLWPLLTDKRVVTCKMCEQSEQSDVYSSLSFASQASFHPPSSLASPVCGSLSDWIQSFQPNSSADRITHQINDGLVIVIDVKLFCSFCFKLSSDWKHISTTLFWTFQRLNFLQVWLTDRRTDRRTDGQLVATVTLLCLFFLVDGRALMLIVNFCILIRKRKKVILCICMHSGRTFFLPYVWALYSSCIVAVWGLDRNSAR